MLTTTDQATEIRRRQCDEIASDLAAAQAKGATHDDIKLALEMVYGQTWDTTQMQQDFEVLGFAAPLVVVRRRSDGKKGSLYFTHGYNPRLYYSFQEN